MTPERHIGACTSTLLEQRGNDAWFHGSQKADELLIAGDLDGNAMFRAILKRIADLEKMIPSGMVH